ncbi:hypothetical protein BASA50_009542 [Batrachochytrium salamandrivorans]|uniref:Cytochrome b5 heme-binding domain-containing protein n=1 Tax=Batrachochytrium salamandrivorans TaxID=1357716 RepID=A0ABQ8F1B1_9FUNG|nr:hypothetical protein BASA62_009743 [Batrachochytrium salamandrivorans]KAH6561833.1 hypothetical protein BASA60_011337 [Batrachochytrium salamandrivorans]KAH6586750.1 hypothetical protein BASA61_006461 [Batrachochytrium salamandrivorans]KAH6590282.1 hypothetical protein BASA50_009542 [Batrachochytrium salamandrivorans]KAH9275212.1 hypothetical protein BASA83_002440 [Batrachochytrium salamandrivorans]
MADRKITSSSKASVQKPSSPKGVSLYQILVSFTVVVCAIFATSYIITDTFDFGGQTAVVRKLLRTHFPAKEIVLTPEMLAKYDGSDPSLPIYIAIKGIIYDVTEGRSYYGKKGSYEFFAGKDATRAYITGCFQADLTHDLRGLSDAQIESLSTWTDFYGKHDKYFQVGRVDNPPIDPASPVPEPCEG